MGPELPPQYGVEAPPTGSRMPWLLLGLVAVGLFFMMRRKG